MRGDGAAETEPAWTAGAVARHLGVAPSTLRTWSRRYGLDPTRHDSGRHRRYQACDIARLDAMRQLVAQGVAPAAAARWVNSRSLAELDSVPEPAERFEGPLPARVVRGLVAAALRLDGDAVAAALVRHLDQRGVISTWNQVCLPVITEIGRVTERSNCIDVEHLLSWTISATLHQVPVAAQAPGRRVVLLACAENEQHTLALDALRAALASRGTAVRMLGAATPTAALAHAMQRCSPGAVVLWAQTTRTARPSQLTALRQQPSAGTVVIAAGPGWTQRRLPSGVIGSNSLHSAVLLTLGAAAPASLATCATDPNDQVPPAAEDRQ
ncbi:MAG TPA: MerR family transcriptional regulator [Pseudonocardiaceae bacterium]|jgi:DNA-binding transcriptional MerR regulator|nr:MerR family transcriptional regulator [Pseudonocardiaceae bacterium]